MYSYTQPNDSLVYLAVYPMRKQQKQLPCATSAPSLLAIIMAKPHSYMETRGSIIFPKAAVVLYFWHSSKVHSSCFHPQCNFPLRGLHDLTMQRQKSSDMIRQHPGLSKQNPVLWLSVL